MSADKKIIIIGGGLAGLTAGALLAKKGLHVLLFEARDKAGGCCATTNMQGFTFNDGALCLILPDVLDHAFSRLGLEREVVVPLRKISASHTTTLPDGAVVTMGEGLQVSVEGGREKIDPAGLRAELEHMLAKWAPVLAFFTQDVAFHLSLCGAWLPGDGGTCPSCEAAPALRSKPCSAARRCGLPSRARCSSTACRLRICRSR